MAITTSDRFITLLLCIGDILPVEIKVIIFDFLRDVDGSLCVCFVKTDKPNKYCDKSFCERRCLSILCSFCYQKACPLVCCGYCGKRRIKIRRGIPIEQNCRCENKEICPYEGGRNTPEEIALIKKYAEDHRIRSEKAKARLNDKIKRDIERDGVEVTRERYRVCINKLRGAK